ncbi:MAG: phospholipid-binding protein MlaC [Alphaproteobacteria bacterium]
MTLLRPISRRTLLLGSLVTVVPISRGIAAPDPRGFINQFWIQAAPFMPSSVPAAQRLAGIRHLLQSSFDVTAITDFVLGRYKWIATPQQIRDFSALYQEYTVQTYSRQLSYLAGARLVLQNMRPSGAETIVGSNVVAPSGGSYRVDWHAVDRGGMYKIADLVIEGVSMKMTHRNEVARWIEINGGGFASALAVLRQQIRST